MNRKTKFENLQPGSNYDNLYHSALCRQRADWLVGLNGTSFILLCLTGRNILGGI